MIIQLPSSSNIRQIGKKNQCIRHFKNVHNRLILLAWNWKQPKCHERWNGEINCGIVTKWNTAWNRKRKNCCHTTAWMNHTDMMMSKRGKTLNTLQCVTPFVWISSTTAYSDITWKSENLGLDWKRKKGSLLKIVLHMYPGGYMGSYIFQKFI